MIRASVQLVCSVFEKVTTAVVAYLFYKRQQLPPHRVSHDCSALQLLTASVNTIKAAPAAHQVTYVIHLITQCNVELLTYITTLHATRNCCRLLSACAQLRLSSSMAAYRCKYKLLIHKHMLALNTSQHLPELEAMCVHSRGKCSKV
jgi:hypothetical protein